MDLVEKALKEFQNFIISNDDDYDTSLIGELAKNDLLRVKGGTADLIGDEDNLAYPDELDNINRVVFDENERRVMRMEKENSRNMVQVGEVHAVTNMKPAYKNVQEFLDKNTEEIDQALAEAVRFNKSELHDLCKVEVMALLSDGVLSGCSILRRKWVGVLDKDYSKHFSEFADDGFVEDLINFDNFLINNELCKSLIDSQEDEPERQSILVRAFFQVWMAGL